MSKTRKLAFSVVFLLLAFLAVLVITPHIGVLAADGWGRIRHYLDVPLFDIGKQPLTTISLIKILLFVAILGIVSGYFKSFFEKKLLVHTGLEEGQRYAIARITSYLFFALGMVIGLESTGLDLSSLVVLGGALGLGVGLGLQTVVSNFVAGLILLLEQLVRVGDRIQVGDTYGDVVALKGRSTWIRTNDNVVIIVPNSDFIEKSVTNWTANDRQVRVNIPIGVSYGCNPVQVKEVLLRIAAANPDVMATPAPDVYFEEFGDSSLNFTLRVWTTTKVHIPLLLKSDLYFAIFEEFGKLGIEIPFPQRDLHLRSIDPDAAKALRG
ncbi:MAG TPA: mechanosensitive ion channel domain-containing protein [Terracidiphilus sp.]|nr:mechanosensitive ion channel domain-containing protein [Terracidiphilus sp.]